MNQLPQSLTTNHNTWCFGEVKLQTVHRVLAVALVASAGFFVLLSLISARYIPFHPVANWTVGGGLILSAIVVLNTMATLANTNAYHIHIHSQRFC